MLKKNLARVLCAVLVLTLLPLSAFAAALGAGDAVYRNSVALADGFVPCLVSRAGEINLGRQRRKPLTRLFQRLRHLDLTGVGIDQLLIGGDQRAGILLDGQFLVR